MIRSQLNQTKRGGGFALGIVMCALIILLVIGAGVVRIGMHGRAIAVRDSSQITARSAADAGLTQALYSMNQMVFFRLNRFYHFSESRHTNLPSRIRSKWFIFL
jgi:Tfp pilus assembly protein PilX